MAKKRSQKKLKPRACVRRTLYGEIDETTGLPKGRDLKLLLNKCSEESKIKSSSFDILVG